MAAAYHCVMKRAVLVMLLAACQASPSDYPSQPNGGPPVHVGSGSGGTTGDAGTGDAGDGGVAVTGRLCIVNDLRTPTVCDTTQDASRLTVLLGTRSPDAPPAKTGEFTIHAPLGTGLVWRVSGLTVISTVMPYGTDNLIPVVREPVYTDLLIPLGLSSTTPGQGSVVVRALRGGVPASGVTATSTLMPLSSVEVPRYDQDNSAVDWASNGPTQSHGIVWFPGVQPTTTPARVILRVGTTTAATVDLSVAELAITFVTIDLQ